VAARQDPALPVAAVPCRRSVTGSPGKYVSLKEPIRGFREIVDGKHDALPEQASTWSRHRRSGREGEEGLIALN